MTTGQGGTRCLSCNPDYPLLVGGQCRISTSLALDEDVVGGDAQEVNFLPAVIAVLLGILVLGSVVFWRICRHHARKVDTVDNEMGTYVPP